MEFTDKHERWMRTTGATKLHYFAKKGLTEEVLSSLPTKDQAQCEACLLMRSRSGLTILHYCAIYGRVKTAEEILFLADSMGIFKTIMRATSSNGSTALHCAFESRRIRLAIRLIELGGAEYLSLLDHNDHQPLEVCDRRIRAAVEEDVKRAIRSYYYWGRRRGFVMLLARLKRSQSRYEENWKSPDFHTLDKENLDVNVVVSKKKQQQQLVIESNKKKRFMGLKRKKKKCSNKDIFEDTKMPIVSHFYHHNGELSCPRQIYMQAKVRGILAENYYRFREAGYENEDAYKRDSRGLDKWGPPEFWENKSPFRSEVEVARLEREERNAALHELAAHMFHYGGNGDDSFIRVLRHLCIRDAKPSHPQKGRCGGVGDANIKEYSSASSGLAGKVSLHRRAILALAEEEGSESRGGESESERVERRKQMIFKKHRTHQAAWKSIQDMYCDDEWWRREEEVKLVRRLRHADSGYHCYFRKDKEFLFEHKGVDPKEVMMAFVLLNHNICRKVVSFL